VKQNGEGGDVSKSGRRKEERDKGEKEGNREMNVGGLTPHEEQQDPNLEDLRCDLV
jgi:hypothetical protein